MRRRPSHFLFACLLTVIASGDDFNLMRVAFPPLRIASPAEGLPLDDPNTDFLAASSTRPDSHRADAPVSLPAAVSPRHGLALIQSSRPLAARVSDHPLPCAPIAPPLRC
jgi:hypothetical protein